MYVPRNYYQTYFEESDQAPGFHHLQKSTKKIDEVNIESQTIGLIKESRGKLCSMSIWEDLGV